jgi:hypothetical protein
MKTALIDVDWHQNLSIYASSLFLKTVSEEYGWLGGFNESHKLFCVQPFSVIRKGGFRLVRFPTQTVSLNGDLSIESEQQFLNNAVDYFRTIGADVIVPATVNTIFRTYPDGAIVAPYGTHIIDLTQTEEALWNNLHSKHRNVIRNANKKGVKIVTGIEYLPIVFNMVRDSFLRSAQSHVDRMRVDLRMSFDTFRHQVLSLGENIKVMVADYGGIPQGCAVIPFSNYCAYYLHGGSISNPLTGAMNLLIWETIRLFRGLGVHLYDFCGARIDPEIGSKAERIIKFKERFGGKVSLGYMWKAPLRPIKYHLYSLAARIRNGGDLVDQEHHKLSSFQAT